MKIVKHIITIAFFLCSFAMTYAQKDIRFRHITINDGLSQSTVNCIYRDSRGFMWFGTEDGLNRYDGYQFIVFKSKGGDTTSISNNNIRCIFEDSNHNLWIGTSNGLNKYNRNHNTFNVFYHNQNNPNSLSDNYIWDIIEDSTGNLWIATKYNGLNRYNPKNGSFKHYKTQTSGNSITNNEITSLGIDAEKNLWIGTFGGGLNKMLFPQEEFISYQHKKNDTNSISGNIIYDFVISKSGIIWIATKNGLNRFDPESETFTHYKHEPDNPNSLSRNKILNIEQDYTGDLWLSADGLDHFICSKNKFVNYKHSPSKPLSVSANGIYSLYHDNAGKIWIGTFGAGVNIYNRKREKFKHYPPDPNDPNTVSHKYVWCFYQDKDGIVWIGTDNGLDKFDRKNETFTNYRHEEGNPKSLSRDRVWMISPGKEGTLWLATSDGLNRFDKKTEEFTRFYHQEGNPNTINDSHVRDLYLDADTVLWIATWGGGLDEFDLNTGKITHHVHDKNDRHSISHNDVWLIYEDKKGNIWTGGYDGGLCKYNRQTELFVNYKNDPEDPTSLSYNTVMSIHEDKAGNFWIGTWGAGLDKFDRRKGTFKHYTTNHGLPNGVIYGILEDGHGNLWLSTNNGLSKFNPAKESFTNYYETDGLQSHEFNGGAAFKNDNGEMFFGGIWGFNVFHPDSITASQNVAPIVITKFKLFNKPVPIGKMPDGRTILNKSITETDEIILSYKDYVFSFEFAVLNFEHSNKVKYAYKLNGFDMTWNITSESQRFANYTNIGAGNYTFMVKATNTDGVWSKNPAKIRVIIRPPFWETWWFRVLAGLIILVILILIYRNRIKRIEINNRLLEEKVKSRTFEVVKKNKELHKQKEKLTKAYENIKMLSELGREITANLTVEKIITTVYKNINTLMDATIFGIGIYNADTESIDFSGTKERDHTLPFCRYELTETNRLAVICFSEQKEIIISSYAAEYNKFISKIQPPKAGDNPVSIMYLPLNIKDKNIGVITVQSFVENAYSKVHVNIIRNIAIYTAIAIENAESYLKIGRQAENLQELNIQLEEQQEEIKQSAVALQYANEAIKKEKEYTLGSIRYAKNIQTAILPQKEDFEKLFECFVLFRPKDIVSGDFYWLTEIRRYGVYMTFIAAVDCTGHGVPGAFMSMIGYSLLNEIVKVKKIFEPEKILDQLNDSVIKSLRQNVTDNHDGMDISICALERIPHGKTKVHFAGAKQSLFYRHAKDEKIKLLKGDRQSIGGLSLLSAKQPFTGKEVELTAGDVFYLATDGIIDQNNPQRKRFGTLRLMKKLSEVSHLSMSEQKEKIEKMLENYQQNVTQRDDITLLGFRI